MEKPTFKNMCMMYIQQLTNFPFIEQDFDFITNYEFLCLVVEHLNQVITNSNTQNDAITNLYNAFVELKDYVDNYFDNLDVQEEINNKLDEMVESGEFQEILEEYIETKVDYFYIDENSTFTDIKNAFESSKTKVIEFKNGTYSLTDKIYLTSNTKVILNNSTLNSEYVDEYGDNLVFMGYPVNSTYTEYNGISNVHFLNGNINTGFALMHNTNIEFNNINFGGLKGHGIQIGGCKDIKIINCKFSGVAIDDANGANHEIIQLERSTYGGQPYLDPSSVSYDETGNFNILISNCIFDKGNDVTTRYYVGIGHHSYSADYPYYNENITIEKCIFKDSTISDISGGSFHNIEIKDCEFSQSSSIASHIQVRIRFLNKNVKIYNNLFKSGRYAIYQVNNNQNEDWYIYNNKINMDSSGGIGIGINAVTNCYIHDNFIKTPSHHITISQVDTYTTDNINVYNNVIDMTDIESTRYGIACYGGSNLNINNNKVIQNMTNNFLWINGPTSYTIYKNILFGSYHNVGGLNIDYENIYNVNKSAYSTTATSYSALENQSSNAVFSKFNTLEMLVVKAGNAAIMSKIKLKPYSFTGKFDARKYYIPFNIDGTAEYLLFEINSDGTFNYTSSSGNALLRSIECYNE